MLRVIRKYSLACYFSTTFSSLLEKVQLTKLDNQNSICVIETSKNVDGIVLNNDIIEYLKKVSKKDAAEIESELRNEKPEFTESSVQQL